MTNGTLFTISRKVFYHHTDAGGVVYYANYLQFLEEARSEFCLNRGVDLVQQAASGILFPVVHIEVDYRSPARYGDIVTVATRVEKIGNASVHFAHQIKRGDILLVDAKVVWASVDRRMKPRRISDELKNAIGNAV